MPSPMTLIGMPVKDDFVCGKRNFKDLHSYYGPSLLS